MAWKPDYLTAAEFKHAFNNIPDTNDDAEIGFAITAASRAIDAYCGRQFGNVSTTVTRYYTPQVEEVRTSRLPGSRVNPYWNRYVVKIDDLMDTTDLVVKTDPKGDGSFDVTMVLDTDFHLAPFNAAADGRPWTRLVPMVNANGITGLWFPNLERSVQIAAKWGWSAVPTIVKQACLIQASRIFKRKDAPFGIAGSPEVGSEMRLLARLDPDVAVLLNTVKRYESGVA